MVYPLPQNHDTTHSTALIKSGQDWGKKADQDKTAFRRARYPQFATVWVKFAMQRPTSLFEF